MQWTERRQTKLQKSYSCPGDINQCFYVIKLYRNSVENTVFRARRPHITNSVVLRDFTALLEILIPERHPVRNMGEDLFALHLETPVGSLISRLVPSELSLLLLARASDTVVIGAQHWRPRKRTTSWECVLSYGKKVLPCVQATTL